MDETLNTGQRGLGGEERFAQRVDVSNSTESTVDLRLAWAVIVGDRPTVNINVGVGPLVPRPGSPAAQVVDDLTANLRPPQSLEGLVALSKRNRWVVLHGSAGSGKSTALAALVRPDLTEGRVPKDFVHAVVQLDSTSTAWWLAEQLADQLRLALPRYTPAVEACRAVDAAAWDAKTLWQRRVLEPLTLLTRVDQDLDDAGPGKQPPAVPPPAARIVIDGWEQVHPDYAADLHQVVHALAHDEQALVHVIVGARTSTVDNDVLVAQGAKLELPTARPEDLTDYLRTRQLPAADAEEIAELCTRGVSAWLLVRLIGDTFADLTPSQRTDLVRHLALEPTRHPLIDALYAAALDLIAEATPGGWAATLRPVLAALAVPGAGPVMPLHMLHAITAHDDLTPDTVNAALDALDRYVIRTDTGTDHELLGLFHPTLADYLTQRGPHWVDTTNTRTLILDEIEHLAPVDGVHHDTPLTRWADHAEVDYLWAAGMPRAAVQAMIRRPLPTPRANLTRWHDVPRRLHEQLGTFERLMLTVRYFIAYFTGESGDPVEALKLYQELLPDWAAVEGPRHPDTLTTRSQIAFYTGQTGHPAAALKLCQELLPDQEAVLGPRDPGTLRTRHQIAAFTGQTGHPVEALNLFQELLPDWAAVDGPRQSDTLTTRSQIAFYTGATGHPADALKLYQELLPDRAAILGPRHPDTLRNRSQIASYTGATGHHAEALKLYQELLPDQESVLGSRHPDTLTTRHQIAAYTGATGHAADALKLYQDLLPDRAAVIGLRHPDTLSTRSQIAAYTGATGHPADALKLYQELLPDQDAVIGLRHPDTLTTRHQIAFYTGETGNAAEALKHYQELFPDRAEALGPRHPDTLRTRSQIAFYTGRTGHPAEALKLYEELLPDRAEVLGPRHPDTLSTRYQIAIYTGETGHPAKALDLLEHLLPEMATTLGPQHPDTERARAGIALLTGRAAEP